MAARAELARRDGDERSLSDEQLAIPATELSCRSRSYITLFNQVLYTKHTKPNDEKNPRTQHSLRE